MKSLLLELNLFPLEFEGLQYQGISFFPLCPHPSFLLSIATRLLLSLSFANFFSLQFFSIACSSFEVGKRPSSQYDTKLRFLKVMGYAEWEVLWRWGSIMLEADLHQLVTYWIFSFWVKLSCTFSQTAPNIGTRFLQDRLNDQSSVWPAKRKMRRVVPWIHLRCENKLFKCIGAWYEIVNIWMIKLEAVYYILSPPFHHLVETIPDMTVLGARLNLFIWSGDLQMRLMIMWAIKDLFLGPPLG